MAEIINKKLLTRNRNGTSAIEVYYENGGELPQNLSGAYTSVKKAQEAITLYLIEKKRPNVTTSSK